MTLGEASTFTGAPAPPRGGQYLLFREGDRPSPSPYDRVQFIGFHRVPSFDVDVMGEGLGGWTLSDTDLVDVFMDQRGDPPVFTVVEVKGKWCRVEQVEGEREVPALARVWLSLACLEYALAHGTLELLS